MCGHASSPLSELSQPVCQICGLCLRSCTPRSSLGFLADMPPTRAIQAIRRSMRRVAGRERPLAQPAKEVFLPVLVGIWTSRRLKTSLLCKTGAKIIYTYTDRNFSFVILWTEEVLFHSFLPSSFFTYNKEATIVLWVPSTCPSGGKEHKESKKCCCILSKPWPANRQSH